MSIDDEPEGLEEQKIIETLPIYKNREEALETLRVTPEITYV